MDRLDFSTTMDEFGEIWIRAEAIREFIQKLVATGVYPDTALKDFDGLIEQTKNFKLQGRKHSWPQ